MNEYNIDSSSQGDSFLCDSTLGEGHAVTSKRCIKGPTCSMVAGTVSLPSWNSEVGSWIKQEQRPEPHWSQRWTRRWGVAAVSWVRPDTPSNARPALREQIRSASSSSYLKDKKTKRQNDRKTERQNDKKTKRIWHFLSIQQIFSQTKQHSCIA